MSQEGGTGPKLAMRLQSKLAQPASSKRRMLGTFEQQVKVLAGSHREEFRILLGMIFQMYLRQEGDRVYSKILLNEAHVIFSSWYHNLKE